MKKILLLITLFTLPLFATNWYVDKNATGLNNGTSWTNAWESFADINWASIDAGDTLFISGGTDSLIYYETLEIYQVQGTAANPITVIAGKYAPNPTGHSGRVIIDGGNNTRTRGIWIVGTSGTPTSYIILKGIESRLARTAIHIEDYANVITIDSCYCYDFYDLAGVFTNATTTGDIDSVTIKNCTIISAVNLGEQTDGIYIAGSTNTVIHDNYIRQRSLHPSSHVDGIQSHHTSGFVIYNNIVISDSVDNGGGGYPFIVRAFGTLPVIVYNNFFYAGGIWYENSNNGTVFNTHEGDQGQGYGDPPPTYIFNNTIVGNGPQENGVVLNYFGENGDGIFCNNIVAQFGDGIIDESHPYWGYLLTLYNGSGYDIDVDSVRNNLIWREWGEVDIKGSDAWTNGTTSSVGSFDWDYWTGTLGGTGVNSNPLFVNNIGYEPDQGVLTGELQATSPAINAGEDLTYLKNYLQSTYGIVVDIEHDINGLTRDTENPTIGAYEYQSGEPTPAQTKKVRVIIIQ